MKWYLNLGFSVDYNLHAIFWFSFSLQLPQTKPPTNINLFDESSPFIKKLLYISLGVLGGLLLVGTLWNIFLRKKRANQTTVSGEHLPYVVMRSLNQGKITSRPFSSIPTVRLRIKSLRIHILSILHVRSSGIQQRNQNRHNPRQPWSGKTASSTNPRAVCQTRIPSFEIKMWSLIYGCEIKSSKLVTCWMFHFVILIL